MSSRGLSRRTSGCSWQRLSAPPRIGLEAAPRSHSRTGATADPGWADMSEGQVTGEAEGRWVKAHYLDASALVMLVVDEDGAPALRDYYDKHSTFCTTPLCLAEALGVLKRKWLRDKQLTTDQYYRAAQYLIAHAWGERIRLNDVGLVDPRVHVEVERQARAYGLDLSDALQLETLKHGYFSAALVGPSAPVLITGDRGLASAATAEKIRVWNCKTSAEPPWPA